MLENVQSMPSDVCAFTREFYRPTDRVRDVPPEVAKRFYEDNRRFPPGSYTDASLVWKETPGEPSPQRNAAK